MAGLGGEYGQDAGVGGGEGVCGYDNEWIGCWDEYAGEIGGLE